jgi:receptor expression-enhancing protein 5/6
MSALQTTLDDLRKKIYVESPAPFKDIFHSIEEKTKINIEYFVLALGVLLGIFVFAGVGAGFISNAVGFLYPAFATLTVLENSTPEQQATTWLTYWLVFGTIGFAEQVFAVLISRIPLFYPIKITILLWSMLPQYKGADWIRKNVISQLTLGAAPSSPVDSALNSADPQVTVEKAKDN